MAPATWIAADWGTSNLRVWPMDSSGTPLAQTQSGKGMGQLDPGEFEAAFLELAAEFLPETGTVPVIVCGMAGARQGWTEAPYARVPAAPTGEGSVAVSTRDPRLDVRILPGICQENPADVMRGEETQIAGYLLKNKGFSGILCLPGTHTKWVRISDGTITGFQTVMTGELFALLSGASVLRHSLDDNGWDQTAFEAGVSESLGSPETVFSRLFAVRAQSLLKNNDGVSLRSKLSGLLLGYEVASVLPDLGNEEPVLIGGQNLTSRYASALKLAGRDCSSEDGSDLVLGGLRAAYENLFGR